MIFILRKRDLWFLRQLTTLNAVIAVKMGVATARMVSKKMNRRLQVIN